MEFLNNECNFENIYEDLKNDCKFIPSGLDNFNKYETLLIKLYSKIIISKNTLKYFKDLDKDYLIDKYVNDYNNCCHPSKLAKYEIFNDFLKTHTDILISSKLENYTINFKNKIPKEENITNLKVGSCPSIVTVLKMNVISPIITGYFFEELLNQSLINENETLLIDLMELDLNLTDIKNLLKTFKYVGIDEINSYCYVNSKNFEYIYYYILFKIIICNSSKMDYRILVKQSLQIINNLFNSYENYMIELDKYFLDLSNCYYICKLKQKNIKHSVKLNDDELIGESDFIIDDLILDCKCYISPTFDLWRYQLMYYYGMNKNENIKKLSIINLLENKIYTWELN